jgi:hypothetical protein
MTSEHAFRMSKEFGEMYFVIASIRNVHDHVVSLVVSVYI